MKDHQQLVRDLLKRGLDIAHDGGGHLKVRDDQDNMVVLPVSPGRGRGDRNALAELRRAGMIDPPTGGAGKRGRRPEQKVKPYEGPRLPQGRIPRKESHDD